MDRAATALIVHSTDDFLRQSVTMMAAAVPPAKLSQAERKVCRRILKAAELPWRSRNHPQVLEMMKDLFPRLKPYSEIR